MIQAKDFLDSALQRGFGFYTGVPCSFLTPLIDGTISDPRTNYIGATSEGEAVGMAAGAWLSGRRAVVMCQNSGLGNMVNPLTSLAHPFQIPMLLVVTLRGDPDLHDEPQHELMGRITQRLLSCIEVRHRPFPRDPAEIGAALDEAEVSMAETSLPYCLVMKDGDVVGSRLDAPEIGARAPGRRIDLSTGGDLPARHGVLERLLVELPESAAIIATTGKCGRELFTLADRPQHLYLVGSMGCASAVGLGTALGTRRRVVVLDGDGAALMKLGNLATIGRQQPDNLLHVVLDNQVHDSTGGQATASPVVDFAAAALACGYRHGSVCDSVDGVTTTIRAALQRPGPEMIHVKIRPGSMAKLGRPTVPPPAVARRFQEFLATSR